MRSLFALIGVFLFIVFLFLAVDWVMWKIYICAIATTFGLPLISFWKFVCIWIFLAAVASLFRGK